MDMLRTRGLLSPFTMTFEKSAGQRQMARLFPQ